MPSQSLIQIQSNFTAGKIDKMQYLALLTAHHDQLFDYPEILAQSEIDRIEISPSGVIFHPNFANFKVYYRKGDMRAASNMALGLGSYERPERIALQQILTDETVIFDIGANCGWFGLELASRLNAAQLYCFEPCPKTYTQLTKNIELNNFQNIEAYNFGFSDENGSFEIFFDERDSAVASLRNTHEYEERSKVSVEMRRIDDFSETHSLNADFIKADVEGAELLVLKGAENTLINSKPIIFLEMVRKWTKHFNYHPNDIVDFLAKHGYECFVIPIEFDGEAGGMTLKKMTSMNDTVMETNFIFLNRERHQKLISEQTQ